MDYRRINSHIILLGMVNQHNYRCKNKYLRFEIGIAPKDRDKLAPGDMSKIAHEFARRMGLRNHQWIACTHKDTGKPHIHLIANRVGVDGKVFDTTFMSNRSARIAEEMSREMGLTIANEVRRQKPHQEAHVDPNRQQAKERLQCIAYAELNGNTTLAGFLYGLDRRGVGIEPAKNKQGDTYGIRFSCEGHTFKASEIGREFGYHSLAGNFSSSPRSEQSHSHDTADHHYHSYGGNVIIESLLGDLLSGGLPASAAEDDNKMINRKKPKKRRQYGRQQ